MQEELAIVANLPAIIIGPSWENTGTFQSDNNTPYNNNTTTMEIPIDIHNNRGCRSNAT